jgi:predicted nucleic acid-binding protein
MMLVDASALLEVLLNTPAGVRLANRLLAPDETLHAPHLIDLEIAQALRRYTLSGQLDAGRGLRALEILPTFRCSDIPMIFSYQGSGSFETT